MANFQREGSISNTSVGREFEDKVENMLQKEGIDLQRNYKVLVGIGSYKKPHSFDLGSVSPPVVVECKSHTWTRGDNMPSGKIHIWICAMYYFHMTSSFYRKIFIVQKSLRKRNGESLLRYFIRIHRNLIPNDVELREFDVEKNTAEILSCGKTRR